MCAFMRLSHDWSMRDLLESSMPVTYSEHVITIAHVHVYCMLLHWNQIYRIQPYRTQTFCVCCRPWYLLFKQLDWFYVWQWSKEHPTHFSYTRFTIPAPLPYSMEKWGMLQAATAQSWTVLQGILYSRGIHTQILTMTQELAIHHLVWRQQVRCPLLHPNCWSWCTLAELMRSLLHTKDTLIWMAYWYIASYPGLYTRLIEI